MAYTALGICSLLGQPCPGTCSCNYRRQGGASESGQVPVAVVKLPDTVTKGEIVAKCRAHTLGSARQELDSYPEASQAAVDAGLGSDDIEYVLQIKDSFHLLAVCPGPQSYQSFRLLSVRG